MLSRGTQTLHLAAGLADRAPVSLGEASTTVTSRCWSWRSATPPDDASSLASG